MKCWLAIVATIIEMIVFVCDKNHVAFWHVYSQDFRNLKDFGSLKLLFKQALLVNSSNRLLDFWLAHFQIADAVFGGELPD